MVAAIAHGDFKLTSLCGLVWMFGAVFCEEWLRKHWPLLAHSPRAALALALLRFVCRCFSIEDFLQTAATSYVVMIVPARGARASKSDDLRTELYTERSAVCSGTLRTDALEGNGVVCLRIAALSSSRYSRSSRLTLQGWFIAPLGALLVIRPLGRPEWRKQPAVALWSEILDLIHNAGGAGRERSSSIRGRINPMVIARIMRNAVVPLAMMLGRRSGGTPGPIEISWNRPVAARNRKKPGIIETTAEKPNAAKGRRRRLAIGVTIELTRTHATRAPAATLAPASEMSAQRAACASIPTAIGNGS
jgi:hypothetical protein